MADMIRNLAKQKRRGKRGFSLAEMLVALLITSLAGLLVIGGIEVTTRVFQDTLLRSQAQLAMKEYMSELRSGLLNAEMNSALKILEYNSDVPESTDPVFAHSGQKCAGFFKIVDPATGTTPTPDGDGKTWGTILFQPVLYDYSTNTGMKVPPVGQTLPNPVPLIGEKLSRDFPAYMTYQYRIVETPDGPEGKFFLKLSVRSRGTLSSGGHVEICEDEFIEITPTGE